MLGDTKLGLLGATKSPRRDQCLRVTIVKDFAMTQKHQHLGAFPEDQKNYVLITIKLKADVVC